MFRTLTRLACILSLCISSIVRAGPLWLSDGVRVYALEKSASRVEHVLERGYIASIAATTQGEAWVLSDGALSRLTSNGRIVAALDLFAMGAADATRVVVDAADASLWLTAPEATLLHLSANGTLLGRYLLDE